MIINKKWAMPNKNTFTIKPINELIKKYIREDMYGIDPFARSSLIASVTNDLDTDFRTTYNMDALEFLKMFEDNSVDYVLFDPPYSPRQVSEVYKKMDKAVNMQTTQSSFWGNIKKEISRVLKPSGISISFGWNSNGVGKSNSMKQIEILLVAHGGWHNDTIVTVERKEQ